MATGRRWLLCSVPHYRSHRILRAFAALLLHHRHGLLARRVFKPNPPGKASAITAAFAGYVFGILLMAVAVFDRKKRTSQPEDVAKVLIDRSLPVMIGTAIHFDRFRQRSLLASGSRDGPRLCLITWNIGYAELEKRQPRTYEDMQAVADTI